MAVGLLGWAARAMPRRTGLNRADVVRGYVWLLGREPSRDEILAAQAHFGAQPEPLHVFQNGLIVSEEFRLRRIHVQQVMRVDPVDLMRRKIVLVHIEKCGGTTLRTMLASQVAAGRVCPEHFNGLADWTANELAAYDLFAGHFDLVCAHVVPGPCAVVTMLREPRARLLSLYNFWKAHRPHPSFDERTLVGLAQRHSAAEFFGHRSVVRHPNIRDAMVGQLTRRIASPILADGFAMLQPDDAILAAPEAALDEAWQALAGLASFGLVEQFERSRLLMNRQLGLDMQPVAPQQALDTLTSPMLDPNRPAPETMTPPLAAMLDALTPLDQALYARASHAFSERAGRLA